MPNPVNPVKMIFCAFGRQTSTIRPVEVFTIEETRQLPQGQLVRETVRRLPVSQPQHPAKRPAVKITRHSPNVRYRLGTDSIQHRARNTLPETPRPMILFCESFAWDKVVNNQLRQIESARPCRPQTLIHILIFA